MRPAPLIDHAVEAIRLAAAMPGEAGGTDAAAVRQRCVAALADFAAAAAHAGHEAEAVDDARFALVALIDERAMVAGSPLRQAWLDRPLQLALFDCTSAGEEFFRRLERWRRPRTPAEADVLEVFQACLALGFRGMLAGEAAEPGRRQLAEQAALEVLSRRELPDGSLSPAGLPAAPAAVAGAGTRRLWLVPLAAAAAVVLAALAGQAWIAAAAGRLAAELR